MLLGFFTFLGLMGLLATTWLFPVLAKLFVGNKSKDLVDLPISGAKDSALRVAVLIPAYNEEQNLGRTLESVNRAIKKAQGALGSSVGSVEFAVRVGADGCTDGTRSVAERMGAEVTEFKQQGKWRTILSLARECEDQFDWVILADAGIIWPEEFLSKAIPLCRRPEVMAVAPTYRTPGAGAVENLVWSVERYFKGIESELGGPVSIHGATVFYRIEEFKKAQEILNSGNYLNDDVVLPLTLRALFPEKRIVYVADLGVSDQLEVAQSKKQNKAVRTFKRRRRLVLGNIQWIKAIFPLVCRKNPVAAVLALRRVFRVLWAYWGLSMGVVVSMLALKTQPTEVVVAFTLLGAAGAFRFRRTLSQIFDSMGASLLAPYYFFSTDHLEKGTWK